MEGRAYKKGEVAKALGTLKVKPENEAIGRLFSPVSQGKTLERGGDKAISKGKKRKMSSIATPIKHKKKKKQLVVEDDNKDELARPRRNRKHRSHEQEQRTVFVGNLPNSVTPKEVRKLFKEHGTIESVRLRSAAPADPKTRKRAVVISKEFHPDVQSIHAYVVFKEKAAAAESLKMNGAEFEEHHLRVDWASGAKKHDTKKSIFIGNLPFDAEEEVLWKHFEDCGEIENVRLVRDAGTRIGKGIAYIAFEDDSSVSLALKLEGQKLQGRKLRVQRAVKKEKVKKNLTNDKAKKGGKHKANTKSPGKKKIQGEAKAEHFAKSQTTNYQGLTASTEAKKAKKKQKKQKKNQFKSKLKNQIYLSKPEKKDGV